ncbi:MAG: pentapeptide repeat-containing protein [Planctomycetota bacterium]
MTAAQHIIRLPPPWQIERGPQDTFLFRRRFGRPTGLQPQDRIDLVLYWQEELKDDGEASRDEAALTIAGVQLNDANLTDTNPTGTNLNNANPTDANLAPAAGVIAERLANRVLRFNVTSRLLPRNELVVHAHRPGKAAELPFRVQLEIFVGSPEEVVTKIIE